MQSTAQYHPTPTHAARRRKSQTYSMQQIAIMLGVGRNKLFKFLREKKILHKDRSGHQMPYQSYIDAGYFKTRSTSWSSPTTGTHLCIAIDVTEKGFTWLQKLIENNEA